MELRSAYVPFMIMRTAFSAFMLLAAYDKFFSLSTDWAVYLQEHYPLISAKVGLSYKALAAVLGISELLCGLMLLWAPLVWIGAYGSAFLLFFGAAHFAYWHVGVRAVYECVLGFCALALALLAQ